MRLVKLCILIVLLCAVSIFSAGIATGLEEWIHIDIEPYANTKLVNHEWWTLNPGDSTLSRLPIGGISEFEGPDKKVEFQIIDGAIVLFGTNAMKWPKAVNDIVVGGKAKFVYFFHATGWEQDGVPSYKFVMHYRSGEKEELEIISGFNSDDWCDDGTALQDNNSVWGWIKKEGHPCGHAGLVTTKWENPRPNDWIETIDVVSLELGSVPVIPAITLGEATLAVDSTKVVPESTASVTVSISPSPVQSPAPGEQLVLNLSITGGENVAGYQATVQFDTTALRYVSSANGSYLPAGAFVIPPVVSGNRVTLGATSLNGGSQGDGTLATLTFEVVAVKPSSLILSEVKLTDMNADFLSVSSENGEVVGPGTPTQTSDRETVVSLTPSPVASPALGEQLTFNISIVNGKNVAGYAFKLAFDATALRYISSNNADYLPTGAFPIPPVVSGNQVTLSAVSPSGESDGSGTLATLTFEVITAKPSTLRFSGVSLTDGDGNALEVSAENGEVVESVDIRGDINGDGVVNLEDMAAAAVHLGRTSENTADMNGDGVVNAADLLLIAAAIEQGNAAPSLHPRSIAEMFTATEVQQWLQFAHQHGLTGAKYQRGMILLEQFLLILTPKETAILPNYPNPFNPETWIPYHLSNAAEVHISIYAADGKLVRRLWLGHQAAGIYESRSRAAYWDGRNALGEPVASGVYFYTLTAGDFTATRKLLIRK